ncbi:MAG: hypothetical protein GF383_09205 [Candidatus Lokiarchaeota archaeon]|nr:hypothetical protein [Candidatus Lokiarchaeota archaeon]MBD3340670.1 hypothetical protein [Candidatus Lokiarchaeota archaeon]
MIYQGIFNILDIYLNEIDIFYDNIDKYFHKILNKFLENKSFENKSLLKEFKEIRFYLSNELINLGFDMEVVETKFSEQFLMLKESEIRSLSTPMERYEKKFAPVIYEIFLEAIVDYLVDLESLITMMNIKSKGILPIEFIMELKNLKSLLKENPDTMENLRKYVHIRENIIHKIRKNKERIERLEDLENPINKLQLIYLIFRIIDFFNLKKQIDFSHIESYLKENIDEWLVSIPLVTLKNPDLYFCGIYLADKLNVDIDREKITKFLLNLYDDNIDEFEAPIIEATDRLYYFIKSTSTIRLRLTDDQIEQLIQADKKFFEPHYLKELETSQLVVILKLFKLLGFFKQIEKEKISAIFEEIKARITPDGVRQYRDGFISLEATYYVLFCNYMKDTLDSLKEFNFLYNIVSRIYRNLEILDFNVDTNYDLVSEIFYSCESLKLLNCIETKEMIIHLANFLFPQEVVEKLLESEEISKISRSKQTAARFRHLKVNRVTGETIY